MCTEACVKSVESFLISTEAFFFSSLEAVRTAKLPVEKCFAQLNRWMNRASIAKEPFTYFCWSQVLYIRIS